MTSKLLGDADNGKARGMASPTRADLDNADVGREHTDGSVMTIEEQLAAFKNEMTQEALPQIPPKPGWHRCWLTTTNPMDPVHRRLRMGYKLVKTTDLAGFDTYRMKAGEFEGCISVNEMVLAEIPVELYRIIMNDVHNEAPAAEEERIKHGLQELERLGEDSSGRNLGIVEGSGFEEIKNAGKQRRVAIFED